MFVGQSAVARAGLAPDQAPSPATQSDDVRSKSREPGALLGEDQSPGRVSSVAAISFANELWTKSCVASVKPLSPMKLT
jgi:hypothetical protein